jgi:hypothetical protein
MLSIDWHGIRAYQGSQNKGFEELCSQLASMEMPTGAQFIRNAPPDAGVECYVALTDGTEWGWQAKYVFALEDSQWSQIDHSVERALETHPNLRRYFVCTPIDLPDARRSSQRSGRQKWDDHVEKWLAWAAARGTSVEFVYWGSYDLLERLLRPANAGRVRLWFNVTYLDDEWFTRRLDEALKAAGPRYTPELHVDLPISLELEEFGRTERCFDTLKALARGIRERLASVKYAEPRDLALPEPSQSDVSDVVSLTEMVLASLHGLEPRPDGKLTFERLAARG